MACRLVDGWSDFVRRVGAYEAKTHLAALLDDADGATVAITRHGRHVASIVAAVRPSDPAATTALATVDERLAAAASTAGISVVVPVLP